jgi:hypothetical protein
VGLEKTLPSNGLAKRIVLWNRSFSWVKTQDHKFGSNNACILFLFGGVDFGEFIL